MNTFKLTPFALAAMALTSHVAQANPAYDHVVVVMEENTGYHQVIGSKDAPYINTVLAKDGVLITNAFGEQHPSQPNYFWLFSGSNQDILTDAPYWSGETGGPVFDAPNLYTALEQKRLSDNFFAGYIDSGNDSPITNYYQDTPNYANRHVPWLGFKNINNGYPSGVTKDFGTSFPSAINSADFSELPFVSFVIPALNHDMHDYDSDGNAVETPKQKRIAVRNGDAWLKSNLSAYAEWAKTHNSLLIVTFDEDSTHDWQTPKSQGGNGINGGRNPAGLTAPNLKFQSIATATTSGPNHIAMIFYGANLKRAGRYRVPGVGVNNINLLRTIESFYGLVASGQQSPLAVEAGMTNKPITQIFTH